ncbi:MAG: hypothetical protein DRJ66_05710 [Thermoprotei archaeon]|nr:MAG: hypothetical protein DRJ66_05710 [Thermoprotei archaeon]RLF20743.1 MAG: hypothetical protein DRZ82_01155 [Thermoprotei archaeon]
MTGPGPGKIPIKAEVYLEPPHISVEGVDVYVHVKGYSRARVTHIDIEHPSMNVLLEPGEGYYVRIKGISGGFEIIIKPTKFMKRYVTRIRVKAPDLEGLIPPNRTTVGWLGGKDGGVYLGLRKEYVRKLEEWAINHGWKPRGKLEGNSFESHLM